MATDCATPSHYDVITCAHCFARSEKMIDRPVHSKRYPELDALYEQHEREGRLPPNTNDIRNALNKSLDHFTSPEFTSLMEQYSDANFVRTGTQEEHARAFEEISRTRGSKLAEEIQRARAIADRERMGLKDDHNRILKQSKR